MIPCFSAIFKHSSTLAARSMHFLSSPTPSVAFMAVIRAWSSGTQAGGGRRDFFDAIRSSWRVRLKALWPRRVRGPVVILCGRGGEVRG